MNSKEGVNIESNNKTNFITVINPKELAGNSL
jgi:hypothetical protein